jgi:hypothetical protein
MVSSSKEHSIWFSDINFLVPTRTSFPCVVALTPFPGMASNLSGSRKDISLAFKPWKMASPKGCSEFFSAEPTRVKSSVSSIPPRALVSVKTGLPWVMVPVLSSTTVLSL